jgi:hypothetical protein
MVIDTSALLAIFLAEPERRSRMLRFVFFFLRPR